MRAKLSIDKVIEKDMKDKYDYIIGTGIESSTSYVVYETDNPLDTIKHLKSVLGDSTFLDTYGRLYICYSHLTLENKEQLFRSTISHEYEEAWNRLLRQENSRSCITM